MFRYHFLSLWIANTNHLSLNSQSRKKVFGNIDSAQYNLFCCCNNVHQPNLIKPKTELTRILIPMLVCPNVELGI